MTQRKQYQLRLDPVAREQLREIVPDRLGNKFILEAFPGLYRRTLAGLRGKFTAAELSLILDAQNGVFLTAGMSGQHLSLSVADGIALDALDRKWRVSGTTMMGKLDSLSLFEFACLELWAANYWSDAERPNPPEYVKSLI